MKNSERLRFFVIIGAVLLHILLFQYGHAGAQQDAVPPVSGQARLIVQGAEKPVELRELDIRSELVGHLAQTAVEMSFYNPNSRVLEGELQFPLLDGQRVTGFALEMEDGKLRDAVPVEKSRGRQIFEDAIRQNIDPALAEATQGGNFKIRVYPLNPGKTRRVRVTYTERLPEEIGSADSWGARPVAMTYRLPLFYADRVEKLDISVRIANTDKIPAVKSKALGELSYKNENGSFVVSAAQHDAQLREGVLELSIPLSLNEAVYLGERGGKTYFYAEVLTGLSPMMTSDRKHPGTLSILWDASASGGKRNHKKELAFLDAFFAETRNVAVALQRIRDVAEPIEEFTVKNGKWESLRSVLESTVYDGATNLGAFDTQARTDMHFLFSDGLDNYSTAPMLVPTSPLFAFPSAPGAEIPRLKGLADRSRGALIDLSLLDPKAAVDKMMKAPVQVLSVHGAGITDVVWTPPTLSTSTLSIAGVVDDPTKPLRVVFSGAEGKQAEGDLVPNLEDLPRSDHVPLVWASMKVTRLEEEYNLNRGEIRRLGKSFGMATRETSLIVLDRVEDYVRHDIAPPDELKKEYDSLRARTDTSVPVHNKLERVVREWRNHEAWWNQDFPKGDKNTQMIEERKAAEFAPAGDEMEQDALTGDTQATATIALRPWIPDAPYSARMNEAEAKDLYRIYLDERPERENSVAFYLDVAARLEESGQKRLSLRVLSNLAEMDLENRQILRVLGYRLLQAGENRQAVLIFKKVLELGEEEPQSYRDLGLAYAASGEFQMAADRLYDVVEKNFTRDFPGIEVIALSELNAIMAKSPKKLDTRRFDPRLLSNRPLDLRVVLTWDADDTDIDLHVIDPNEEEAYYAHLLTYQGGRVSPDNTQGYGPEEYSLKTAKKGKYRVEVNFYGHRQQIISEATTIQLDFFTYYGTKKQQKQSVTMRLKEAKDRIIVGEFEVK